jgi:hypothetical protein
MSSDIPQQGHIVQLPSTESDPPQTSSLPPPIRYSPANPTNPHVFNRVPFEKRLHWLWLWNPDNEPKHIDCGVAVDTLSYFTSHQTQSQQRYYYGTYHGISDAKKDLETCLHVRTLAQTDPEGAKKILVDRQNEKEFEPEHVWRFRSIPLKFETPI